MRISTRTLRCTIAFICALVFALSAPAVARAASTVSVWRLYNPHDGQHLLTPDLNEYKTLQVSGWKGEGNAFDAPTSGKTPVYRLYNPANGDHLYTAERAEYDALSNGGGWRGEGPKFYSADSGSVPVYRLWNAAQTANGGVGSHLWTTDSNEYRSLPGQSRGAWRQERLVWKGLATSTDGVPRKPTNPATDISDTEPTFLLTSVLCKTSSQGNREWTFQYDAKGNLVKTKHSTLQYDSNNNLQQVTFATGGSSTMSNTRLTTYSGFPAYIQDYKSRSGISGTESYILDPVSYNLREFRNRYYYNYVTNPAITNETFKFDSTGKYYRYESSYSSRNNPLASYSVKYDINGCVSSLVTDSVTGPGYLHFYFFYSPSFTSTYLNKARSTVRANLFLDYNAGGDSLEPVSLDTQFQY